MASSFRHPLSLVPEPPLGGVGPEHPLGKRIDALRHAALRVRNGGDQEAVHDARVATRRLTALLDIWKEELAPKPRRRARRALSRLRGRLSAAREREVRLEQIQRALSEAVGEDAAALDDLVRRIRKRLPEDRARVERAAREKRIEEIVEMLRASLRDGSLERWASAKALEGASPRVARRRDNALAALDEALARPRDEALHAARI